MLAAVLVILAATVLAVVWPRWSKEPQYADKKLSEWIRMWDTTNQAQKATSAGAVRQIGTNAIPSLIAWIKHEPSWPETRFYRIWLRISPDAAKRSFWQRDRLSRDAVCGFRIL